MAYGRKILELTKAELKKVPRLPWGETVECHSLVIVPTNRLHDSEFGCMYFVALDREGNPICKVGGSSDVLHLNGTIGCGDYDSPSYEVYMNGMKPVDGKPIPRYPRWSMDLLPCGYLRLFGPSKIKIGTGISDMDVYSEGFYVETVEND